MARWSSAGAGEGEHLAPKPPRNWGGQLSAVVMATAFQVSPATEMLRPPPPEAVTAVRGRDRLHQPSSQPPEGKAKVRCCSGSSWYSYHPRAQRGLGREPGLRECGGACQDRGREVVMLISQPGVQDARASSLHPTTKKDCTSLHGINLLFFIRDSLPCRVQFWTWGGGSGWEEREEKSQRTTDPSSGTSRSEAKI